MRWHRSSSLTFQLLVTDKLSGGGMVVYDSDSLLCKRVQYSYVQFDQRLIFPKRTIGASIEPHFLSDHGEHIVTINISQVARSNLGTHVPAIKRCSGVGNSSNLHAHIGDSRKSVPLESQLSEPGVDRMTYGNLKNGFRWQFKHLGRLIRHLNDQGKNIERRTSCTIPTQSMDRFGQFYMERVTNDGAICLSVACVANVLRIPNAYSQLMWLLWGKNGDHRPHFSFVRCSVDVLNDRLEDVLGWQCGEHLGLARQSPDSRSDGFCADDHQRWHRVHLEKSGDGICARRYPL